MIKKIIGWVMTVTAAMLVIGGVAGSVGVGNSVIVFGIAATLTIIVIVGINLIMS